MLLPDTDLAGAQVVAERLRAMVAETACAAADGTNLPSVTISVGAAMLAGETEAPLHERADQALYRAKASGRSRVVCDAG